MSRSSAAGPSAVTTEAATSGTRTGASVTSSFPASTLEMFSRSLTTCSR
jgi:hypothetical protein